jgi:cytochrome c biogenesis protein CcmG/thiol:disulfide interchange protein DsbE
MNKAGWPLWLFVLLVMLFSIGMFLNPKSVPSPLIDKPHPPIEGALINDGFFDDTKLKHQAWLLNIWASWCAGCRQEHPQLLALSQQPGLVLVGLNYKDTQQDADDWLQQNQNPFDYVIQDPQGLIGLDWGVIAVPETFLMDSQGIVRAKWTGALTEHQVQHEILPMWRSLNQEATP